MDESVVLMAEIDEELLTSHPDRSPAERTDGIDTFPGFVRPSLERDPVGDFDLVSSGELGDVTMAGPSPSGTTIEAIGAGEVQRRVLEVASFGACLTTTESVIVGVRHDGAVLLV